MLTEYDLGFTYPITVTCFCMNILVMLKNSDAKTPSIVRCFCITILVRCFYITILVRCFCITFLVMLTGVHHGGAMATIIESIIIDIDYLSL